MCTDTDQRDEQPCTVDCSALHILGRVAVSLAPAVSGQWRQPCQAQPCRASGDSRVGPSGASRVGPVAWPVWGLESLPQAELACCAVRVDCTCVGLQCRVLNVSLGLPSVLLVLQVQEGRTLSMAVPKVSTMWSCQT